jgi:hypothetical protein
MLTVLRTSGIVNRADGVRDDASLREIARSLGHTPPQFFGGEREQFQRRFLPVYGETQSDEYRRMVRHMPGFGLHAFGKKGYAWFLNRRMCNEPLWQFFWMVDSVRDAYSMTLGEVQDVVRVLEPDVCRDAVIKESDLDYEEAVTWLADADDELHETRCILADLTESWTQIVAGDIGDRHQCGLSPIEAPECGGVYFVRSRAPNDLAIKIGWGKNIRKRISDLRTAHPWPLECLAYIPGADMAAEKQLHHRFREHRVQDSPGTEWFTYASDIISEILQLREGVTSA